MTSAGKPKEARDAAAKAARYLPTAQAYVRLGILDYNLNDKTAAMADFRKAIEMDGTVGQRLGSILEDRESVRQVLQ